MAVKLYTITFKDLQERTVVVRFINQDIDSGDTVALTPSDRPFVTTEDNDYDPMLPLRASTAQITVKCTHDAIVSIENNLQWAVVALRDDTVMWRGFLRAEMGDMDFSAVPDDITYQADDLLGTLAYTPKTLGSSQTTLYSLLEREYTMLDNSVPVPTRGDYPWETLSTLSAIPWNWVTTENNDEEIPENVPAMANTVEEDIAAFLGVTARYYNAKFYLGSLFGTKFYDSETEVTYDDIDGANLTWTGFSTIKWEQGVGLVEVDSGGNAISDADMPDTSNNNLTCTGYGYVMPQTERDTTLNGYNCFARYLEPTDGHGITLYQFSTGTPGNIWSELGCHVLDVDIWETEGTRKYNFAFSRDYIFVGTGISTDGTAISMDTFSYTSRYQTEAYETSLAAMHSGLTTPLLTLSSIVPIYADNGGITIDLTFQSATFETVTSGGYSYRKVTEWGSDTDFAVAATRALCSLQFGDYWWNGTSWQTTECTFFYMLNTDDNPVVKDLEMMFEGQKLAMEVSGVMSGVLVFKFFGAYWANESSSEAEYTEYTCTWTPEDLIKLSTVEITYNAPLDLLEPNKTTIRHISQRTEAFPEDNVKSVTLSLCSGGDIQNNWGFVYSGDDIIDTLHWPKLREDWKPERLVLKKNVLALSRLRSLATLTINCEYDDLPFRRIALDDRTWYPLAITTDWRDCESEVLVADITDIMAELPAVGTDEESTGGEYTITVTASSSSVTLTMETTLTVDTTIVWSTANTSGEVNIVAGNTTVTFDAGETIQDERDIGFSASTENDDTFTFVYDL